MWKKYMIGQLLVCSVIFAIIAFEIYTYWKTNQNFEIKKSEMLSIQNAN